MGPQIKIFRNWSPNKKLQDEICLMVQIRRITYARYASKNEPALKFRSCRRLEKKVGPKSTNEPNDHYQIVDICLIFSLEVLQPPKYCQKASEKFQKRNNPKNSGFINKKLILSSLNRATPALGRPYFQS